MSTYKIVFDKNKSKDTSENRFYLLEYGISIRTKLFTIFQLTHGTFVLKYSSLGNQSTTSSYKLFTNI